jgi:hypothetical protein
MVIWWGELMKTLKRLLTENITVPLWLIWAMFLIIAMLGIWLGGLE